MQEKSKDTYSVSLEDAQYQVLASSNPSERKNRTVLEDADISLGGEVVDETLYLVINKGDDAVRLPFPP